MHTAAQKPRGLSYQASLSKLRHCRVDRLAGGLRSHINNTVHYIIRRRSYSPRHNSVVLK